jgi:signal peptidase I
LASRPAENNKIEIFGAAMFDKYLKYSYLAQKRERHKLLRVILVLLILFVIYNTICAFIFSVWVLNNDTMRPGLLSGDRFIALSSTLPALFDDKVPFERGSIVILDRGRTENRSWFLTAADNFVRFFTAQQMSIFDRNEQIFIKRLVAIPGDEVSMVNHILRVRPAESPYPLTEFEFSDQPYDLNIPQIPDLWDESLPMSGNMDKILLGPGKCFVISDDRQNSGDSRTWGPVNVDEIIGMPIFRFWPPGRLGRP